MRSSLRELLFVVAVLAFAMASLRFGGVLGQVLLVLAGITVIGLTVIAVVARDFRQTFAIGFLIPCFLYVGTLVLLGRQELDPYDERASITTRLFEPLHEAVRTTKWIDPNTGQRHLEFPLDPNIKPEIGATYLYMTQSGLTGSLIEEPSREEFMRVAHCLLGFTAGYIGGMFAMYIRRSDQVLPQPSDEESS